jgi:hypothetical protein
MAPVPVTSSAAFAPASVREAVAAPAEPRALTTRFADFWLLGGASIGVWLVMFGLDGFRTNWAVDQHFRNLTVTTGRWRCF